MLNPNLGGLFRGPFWGGGGGGGGGVQFTGGGGGGGGGWGGVKLPPYPPSPSCLKLARVMLETWNLVRRYTGIWKYVFHFLSFQKIYLLLPKLSYFLILLMPAFFFQKKTAFFGKNSTFTQSNSVRAVLEIF